MPRTMPRRRRRGLTNPLLPGNDENCALKDSPPSSDSEGRRQHMRSCSSSAVSYSPKTYADVLAPPASGTSATVRFRSATVASAAVASATGTSTIVRSTSATVALATSRKTYADVLRSPAPSASATVAVPNRTTLAKGTSPTVAIPNRTTLAKGTSAIIASTTVAVPNRTTSTTDTPATSRKTYAEVLSSPAPGTSATVAVPKRTTLVPDTSATVAVPKRTTLAPGTSTTNASTTIAVPKTTSAPTTFFTLPREVRDKIYHEVVGDLVAPVPQLFCFSRNRNQKHHALTMVNRQIRFEALHIPYSDNIWQMKLEFTWMHGLFGQWIQSLGDHAASLRIVRLGISGEVFRPQKPLHWPYELHRRYLNIYHPPDGDAAFQIDLTKRAERWSNDQVTLLRNDGSAEAGENARLFLAGLAEKLWRRKHSNTETETLSGWDWLDMAARFMMYVGWTERL